MKRVLLYIVPLVLVLSSCHTRELAYISDAQRDSAQEILTTYNTTILPGDQLEINVEGLIPESVKPFNQIENIHLIGYVRNMNTMVNADVTREITYTYDSTTVSGYYVNETGTIDFPLLGKVSVVGITYDSLSHYIEKRLVNEDYVIDPTVTVGLMNFRVTVVGEVRMPQQIHIQGNRLTIFEALAICGDITVYGQRENVTILRSENGVQEVGEIDLTKKEALESPFYYLHNNDIVYIEPNDRKKRNSDVDRNIPRYISMGVGVLSIVQTAIGISITIQRMNN